MPEPHTLNSHRPCPACEGSLGCTKPDRLAKWRFTLEFFWGELAEWSEKTFGSDKERGPTGPLKHLAKEVQECLAQPGDVEEYADLVFLAFDAARRAGFTYKELEEAVRLKLLKNLGRRWAAPTTDEPVEHVRD